MGCSRESFFSLRLDLRFIDLEGILSGAEVNRDACLRYRRDAGRFLRGERDHLHAMDTLPLFGP
jgi:hypothetical protein